ncbi:MAG: hypothetical protein HQ512_14750 [Rhodospirillales bacterium]|nr:hypothetical protein [Rhodospirillales bacterium]
MGWLNWASTPGPEYKKNNPASGKTAAALIAAWIREVALTGEAVIREDSFNFFHRRRNIPSHQKGAAADKRQKNQQKYKSGKIFQPFLLRFLVQKWCRWWSNDSNYCLC